MRIIQVRITFGGSGPMWESSRVRVGVGWVGVVRMEVVHFQVGCYQIRIFQIRSCPRWELSGRWLSSDGSQLSRWEFTGYPFRRYMLGFRD